MSGNYLHAKTAGGRRSIKALGTAASNLPAFKQDVSSLSDAAVLIVEGVS
jgi:hypothetical protein